MYLYISLLYFYPIMTSLINKFLLSSSKKEKKKKKIHKLASKSPDEFNEVKYGKEALKLNI